jgi:hypothetical protein
MLKVMPESEQIRQVHALAKELAASSNPVIQNTALQILGLSKLLLGEVLPDEFEHVSRFEQGITSEAQPVEATKV